MLGSLLRVHSSSMILPNVSPIRNPFTFQQAVLSPPSRMKRRKVEGEDDRVTPFIWDTSQFHGRGRRSRCSEAVWPAKPPYISKQLPDQRRRQGARGSQPVSTSGRRRCVPGCDNLCQTCGLRSCPRTAAARDTGNALPVGDPSDDPRAGRPVDRTRLCRDAPA